MTNEVLEILKEEHLYTSDEKLARFGYGEWVEEPDEIHFLYKNIECKVLRVCLKEPFNKEHYFGGHLCGYIRIPFPHPYHYKLFSQMHIIVHGGLSYGSVEIGYWIGFDCAHTFDLVPSVQLLFPKNDKTSNFMRYSPIFDPSYKNIDFCINECKSVVDQLIAIQEIKE